MNSNRPFKAAVLAGFLILLAVRIVHIEADPPYNLSMSGAPWGDPGGYNFNARNKALFGMWEIDDYNMMYTSYPPHLLTYGIYRVFGVGFAQQNSVPVLFSFLTLLFFFLILRRRFDEKIALLGVLLLGINYTFLMFSRIANRDMPAVFFLVLVVYFLQKAEDRAAWLPAAGAAAALSLTSKSIFYFILGGALFGYFLYMVHHRKPLDILRRVGFIAAGAAVFLIPWILFIFIPHKASIQSFNTLNVPLLLPPADAARLLRHFWERPAVLLERMPLLAVFGGLFSLNLLHRAAHRGKKLQMTDWVFLSWFFSGALYLAVIYQRFPRRFIPQILPLVFLAVSWAAALIRKEAQKKKPATLRWAFPPLLLVWLLFPVSLFLKFLNSRFPQAFRTSAALNLWLLGLSLLLCAAITAFSLRRFRRPAWNIPVRMGSALVLILFLLYGTGHGRLYLDWALNPPTQFRNISQDYGKAFTDAVFAGLWAPSICTENTHRAHEYFRGAINSRKDFFSHFGVTHVFTTTHYGEDRIFW
ncbi:MAG: glycosyltransferase family 39 protein, partial [Candidatus Aminicenantes bacterium]|nr:glycosyltransferase family 39 protein [Candidatus Aminicenantes bacterium]